MITNYKLQKDTNIPKRSYEEIIRIIITMRIVIKEKGKRTRDAVVCDVSAVGQIERNHLLRQRLHHIVDHK